MMKKINQKLIKMEPLFDLKSGLAGLTEICETRLASRLNKKSETDILKKFRETPSTLIFKEKTGLSEEEYLIVLIALAPYIIPLFYENIFNRYMSGGKPLKDFGGVKGTNYKGFLPTGDTALFLIAGNNTEKRLQLQELFKLNRPLFNQNILRLEGLREGEYRMSDRLILSNEWIERILYGREYSEDWNVGKDIPAHKITTKLKWNDLVLPPEILKQINQIGVWLVHHKALLKDANLKLRITPGYRVLFHGRAGTGKTLTASLLGKQFKKDVYRIDLSQVISKYIGETEKNLSNLFSRAENKDWILFFDEADALFGKRTEVKDSHDRYANQEISYLLNLAENFPGLMILSSNSKNKIDDAFIRRFNEIVHFPLPGPIERKLLWTKTLPAGLKPDSSVNLEEIASKYELTGASILGAVQYASLRSYAEKSKKIVNKYLIEGIQNEIMKKIDQHAEKNPNRASQQPLGFKTHMKK